MYAVDSRTLGYLIATNSFECDHMLTFVLPLTMHLCSGRTLVQSLELWLLVITVASFTIGSMGLTLGQHHPKTYHEGDELP